LAPQAEPKDQGKNKKEPVLTRKGNTNVPTWSSIVPALTVLVIKKEDRFSRYSRIAGFVQVHKESHKKIEQKNE